jgi:hypothetical protein
MKNAVTRLTLAAVTAASIGFGATQALAAPAAEDAALACKPDSCDRYCREKLGGIEGRCTESGQCLCLF